MRQILRQFSSFTAVGFIATAVHYGLLAGLVECAGVPPAGAALTGYTGGGLVSYLLTRRHVFRSDVPHEEAAIRFLMVAAAGFALTYLFMSLLAEGAGLPYLLAQLVTTGIVLVCNFTAHRLWTFPPSASPGELDAFPEAPSRPAGKGRQRREDGFDISAGL
ncbi:MAG TPA: GtrA family protein [Methylocella sp.]|nr:GtrA family protein [Methylocella sp.]